MRFHIATCLILSTLAALPAFAEEEKAQSSEEKQTNKTKKKPQDTAIKLESVFVGDKEQPAVSYFIPWQGIGAPDKLYWNVEEQHDKALDLVDRETMLRSIHFYGEMNLENTQ